MNQLMTVIGRVVGWNNRVGILVMIVLSTHSTKLSAKELTDLSKQMLKDFGYIK